MATQLTNSFGKVYFTSEYDVRHHWVYNNWIGYQTYADVVSGADACLELVQKHSCPYLLNDNRQVIGPWDHAVSWIVQDWAPRASKLGLTHFAHVVNPASMAAPSAEAMHLGVGGRLYMRMFNEIEGAQEWLRVAQRTAPTNA
ncbi:hypothetical protein GCM10027346_40340 [Hymenobacter seoulensis]